MHEKELREILAQLSQDEIDAVESIIIQGNSERVIIRDNVSLSRLCRLGLLRTSDFFNFKDELVEAFVYYGAFIYYGSAISTWFKLTAI